MGYAWKFIGWQTKKHFGWWPHWRKLYARCEKEECGDKKVKLEQVLYEQWRPININTTQVPSYGDMGNSGAADALMDLIEAGMEAHDSGSMTKFEKYLSMPPAFGQQFCDRIKE